MLPCKGHQWRQQGKAPHVLTTLSPSQYRSPKSAKYIIRACLIHCDLRVHDCDLSALTPWRMTYCKWGTLLTTNGWYGNLNENSPCAHTSEYLVPSWRNCLGKTRSWGSVSWILSFQLPMPLTVCSLCLVVVSRCELCYCSHLPACCYTPTKMVSDSNPLKL